MSDDRQTFSPDDSDPVPVGGDASAGRHAVPPCESVQAPVQYQTEPSPVKRRSKTGWIVAIVIIIVLVCTACASPFVLLFGKGGVDKSAFADSVAVIHIDGVIAGTGDSYSGYVTPEWFSDQFDQAADDDMVKAVVLRVDSPGGTVAASEEISAYVAASEKPVIVSIGDIGASGAYMIASQADEIWAMPGTAVGSIGVISEIPNVSRLLDKVGVEFQVVTAGEYKDVGSPYRSLTATERALIQGEVDDAYAQFIDIVADGRDMKRSEVESLATGWVWSGDKAKKLGLIDEIGTYQDALDAAADKGGIDGDYDIVTYDEKPFGDLLSSLLGVVSRFRGMDALGTSRESTARDALPR